MSAFKSVTSFWGNVFGKQQDGQQPDADAQRDRAPIVDVVFE